MKTIEQKIGILKNLYMNPGFYYKYGKMLFTSENNKLFDVENRYSVRMPIIDNIAVYDGRVNVVDCSKIPFYEGEPFLEIISCPSQFLANNNVYEANSDFAGLDFYIVSRDICYGRFGMMRNPDGFFSIKDLASYIMVFGA